MPPKDWKFRVQDILDAVAALQNYTAGMTLEALIQDRRMKLHRHRRSRRAHT
ncbi:MAG: hypothetical protein H0X47_13470 [Nitrospirales bacterium]|nr:hypothetical protein [Nitrospirales bacterium]